MSSSCITLAYVSHVRNELDSVLVTDPSARWTQASEEFAWGPLAETGALCLWQESHRRDPVSPRCFVSETLVLMYLIAIGIDLDPCWGGLHWVPPLPTVRLLLVPHPVRETQGCAGILAPCGGGGNDLVICRDCRLQQL